MKLTKTPVPISIEEFDHWQPALKVITHDHPRRFAALDPADGRQPVAMSWRSDGIAPTVVEGRHSELWLGVDQRIVCIGADGRIVVSLGLASNLLQIRTLSTCVAALCETEVVAFNDDYSIRVIHGVPDLATDIVERAGSLFVSFDDGHDEKLD